MESPDATRDAKPETGNDQVLKGLGQTGAAPAHHQGRRRVHGGRHSQEVLSAVGVCPAAAGRQEAGPRPALTARGAPPPTSPLLRRPPSGPSGTLCGTKETSMTDQASFPGATSRIAIIDLQSGQTVDSVYACSELTAATDRNGKKYLRLKLRDASGEVAAIHFDPSDEALGIAAGDVVVRRRHLQRPPAVRRADPGPPPAHRRGRGVRRRRPRAGVAGGRGRARRAPARAHRLRGRAARARAPGARLRRLARAGSHVRRRAGRRAQPSRVPARPARALAHRRRGRRGRGVAVRLRRPRPRRRRRTAARHRQDPGLHQRRPRSADDRRGQAARRDRHGPRHGARASSRRTRTSRPRPPSCFATSSWPTTACARRAARSCRRRARRSSSTTATT